MIIVIAVILCLFLEIAHKPLVALFLDNAASSQTIVTGESYLKFIGFFFCMIGKQEGLMPGMHFEHLRLQRGKSCVQT